MLRAIALSLLLFISFAVTLPVVHSLAQGNDTAVTRRSNRRYKRHSRAWWRRYRARLARRRAQAARDRALAALRQQPVNTEGNDPNDSASATRATGGFFNDPQGQWSAKLPKSWSNRPSVQNGEMRFRVYEKTGKPVGQAALSFVTSAGPAPDAGVSARNRKQMLAGVPFADLRRTVIDRMVTTQGWVTNDMEREIGGRRVYIVLAQTAASSDGRTPEQHWTFYFTEIDGRIYSLGVAAPRDTVDRLDTEAQQFLNSLRTGNR